MPFREPSTPAPESDSWYLDPLVARQKAEINRSCIRRWGASMEGGVVLKTDLFEEANGADHILGGLALEARCTVGVDVAKRTVERAAKRFPSGPFQCCVSDLRDFSFQDEAFDVIVSTSTLDHFEDRRDFDAAVREITRVLRPGGRMVLLLDNPLNPLYLLLKCYCRWFGPFGLGYSPTRRAFRRQLRELGLEVLGCDYVIHNPRLLSTLLFLALRKTLGSRATPIIQLFLKVFGLLDRLPTRFFTGCFSVLGVRKPLSMANKPSDRR